MAIVNKAYTFTNGQTSDGTQVNQDFDNLYTLVNGNIDSANLKALGVATSNIATEAVTPAKTEGIPYSTDLYGTTGFIQSGLAATKDGATMSQVNITAGIIHVTQADGTLRRFAPAPTNFRSTSANATYYLDFQQDGTWSWATGHSSQSGYITIATVTSDAGSNVATVTQNNNAYSVTILSGAKGPVNPKLLTVSDLLSDYVVSGLLPTTSANLTSTTPAGTAYVIGLKVATADDSHTYTASQDTYIDLSNIGALTYVQVANGGATPSVTVNSIRLAKIVTNVTAVTSVADLRPLPQFNKTFIQEAWIAPTLQNLWVNFGLTNAVAGYKKYSDSMVEGKGLVKSGTTTNGTLIYTLPVGYRPFEDRRFAVECNNGTSTITGVIVVKSDGTVIVDAIPGNASLALEFSFYAEK